MTCQCCKREASPTVEAPPAKSVKPALRPIDYRPNFVALPQVLDPIWDALAVGQTEDALLRNAISLGVVVQNRQWAFVNKLAGALESGTLLETLKNPSTYLKSSGKQEYLTAGEITAKVLRGEYCGGVGIGALLALGEVVVCNLHAGRDLRVWKAIGDDTKALLIVGEKREGVYEGMPKDKSDVAKAFLRNFYDAMPDGQ